MQGVDSGWLMSKLRQHRSDIKWDFKVAKLDALYRINTRERKTGEVVQGRHPAVIVLELDMPGVQRTTTHVRTVVKV